MDAHSVKLAPRRSSSSPGVYAMPESELESQEDCGRRSALQNGKAKILLVDDRPANLLAYRVILEELGEELIMAHSGEEALTLLQSHSFAVILLDVTMPGMDGFETAKAIRETETEAHTPIIFITAYADEMHTMHGYKLGAVDYIFAPVVPEVLRTKVKVFVEKLA